MSLLLKQALALHQSGNLDGAKKLYHQQLSQHPNDANALQLLGSLLAAQNDFNAAIDYLNQSIKVRPQQPQVLANLAICYKGQGQFKKALETYQSLIDLQPSDHRYYLSKVRLLIELEDFESALKTCDVALLSVVEKTVIASKRAYVLGKLSRYEDAVLAYQKLLTDNPNNAEYIHDMALIYRLQGKADLALKHYLQLITMGVSSYALMHNIANAYSDLGMLNQAIDYYQRAISLNPEYVDAHINLNEMLWEQGKTAQFLRSYLQVIPRFPNNMPLKFAYCRALLRTSNYQLCADCLYALTDAQRISGDYFDLLARAEKGLGNLNTCLDLYQQGSALVSFNKEQQLNFAQSLIEADRITSAVELLETLVAQYPQDQFAWALMGVAWRISGSQQQCKLNDYDNLVKVYDIEVPKGFNSVSEFCVALNDYLQQLHTAEKQPLEQTLTGGTQTRGNLFDDNHSLIQLLKHEIEPCVQRYISETREYDFLYSYEPDVNFEFSGSWSVNLKDQGFHTPHVHPMGWISSAFYVALPDVVDAEDQHGWFCLGKPNVTSNYPLNEQKTIQPKIGRLVLFRSYMWHSTKAFSSKIPRTSVAFDIKMSNASKIKPK